MFETLHHVAFSVKNMASSLDFYKKMGFLVDATFDDGNTKIVQTSCKGFHLELFEISGSKELPDDRKELPTDIVQCGIKHFALKVKDIYDVYNKMKDLGVTLKTPVKEARSLPVRYFFMADPDGNLIEIISDI